jgi:hypothetical protein
MKPNFQPPQYWKMKLKKKSIKIMTKNQPEPIRVNLSNPWLGLWEQDNSIKSKLKKITKLNPIKFNVEDWNREKKKLNPWDWDNPYVKKIKKQIYKV